MGTKATHQYVGDMPHLADHHEATLMLENTIRQERLIDADISNIIKENMDLDGLLHDLYASLPYHSLQTLFNYINTRK